MGALGEDDLNTLYSFISVMSLGVAAGSLLFLLGRRLRRRAALILGASVLAFIVSTSLLTPDRLTEVAQAETNAAKTEILPTPAARYACSGEE
jgi:hypothetical protein